MSGTLSTSSMIPYKNPSRNHLQNRSIVFTQAYEPIKRNSTKKPINYSAFLAHFPNLTAVRHSAPLNHHPLSHQTALPDLQTLDITLRSAMLPPLTTKRRPVIRKLVLRNPTIGSRGSSSKNLARGIEPIASRVEELWVHLDSMTIPGKRKGKGKGMPLLLDCVGRVKWESLWSVGVVVNPSGWCSMEGEPLSLVSASQSPLVDVLTLPPQDHLAHLLARLGKAIKRIEIHTTISALIDLILDVSPASRKSSEEELSAPEDILRRIDTFVIQVSYAIPTVEFCLVHVHRSAEHLAKAFELPSHDGMTLRYAASVRHQTDPPEIHHSSRFFNPSDEETLEDILRAREGPAEEAEEVRDEGMEELRYERIEDVEGWDTEEEWM